MEPNQEQNQTPVTPEIPTPETPETLPRTDVEKVIVKLSKDIEYLKNKVVELESEKLSKHFHMSPEEVKEQFMVDPPSKVGHARGARPLLESEIKEALQHVDCAAAVARYLGVSYKTYRKHALKYGLFKANPKGKGAVPKEYGANVGRYPLDKILAGEIIHPTPWKLKKLLFKGAVKNRCCERCGWKEARTDGVLPLVINFVDGDPTHQTLENLKIYCHNCTFVLRGYIRRGIVVFDVV
jgi:hypothetical protein